MTSGAVLPTLLCALVCLTASLQAASLLEIGAAADEPRSALRFQQTSSVLSPSDQWTAFKDRYSKAYINEEEEKRRRVFLARLADIELHNYKASFGQESYTKGLNEWSDLEYSELFAMRGNCLLGHNKTLQSSNKFQLPDPNALPDLPETVDWTTKGYVTPVKNQMSCGSCYAFATTGALEGQIARTTGRLVSLSEQNVVDCSQSWGNHGCGGGWMHQALKYIADNGGVDSEESYPYKNVAEPCKYRESSRAAQDTGFAFVAQGNEALLKWAVATFGPVAVGINIQDSIFDYHEGVYNDTNCRGNMNHAVLVVGYGTYPPNVPGEPPGQRYWLVKNSWGSFWGDNGYIKIQRDADNLCEIATAATLPVM